MNPRSAPCARPTPPTRASSTAWRYARWVEAGLAEEAVQETFLRAWRAGDRVGREIGSLRTWLFAILREVLTHGHDLFELVAPRLAGRGGDAQARIAGPPDPGRDLLPGPALRRGRDRARHSGGNGEGPRLRRPADAEGGAGGSRIRGRITEPESDRASGGRFRNRSGSAPELAAEQLVAAFELLDGGVGDGATLVPRLMRAWISRWDLPVRRATSPTRRLRSARRRSRAS